MCKITKCIVSFYIKCIKFFECLCMPLLVLFIRIWVGKIFWYSGLTKIATWDLAVYLFRQEYKVPVVSPEIAAYLATGFELSCPILLLFGFMSRIAAIPMLIMTAVIQFTYLDLIDHLYWAICLYVIIFYGPGWISVDAVIRKKYFNKKR